MSGLFHVEPYITDVAEENVYIFFDTKKKMKIHFTWTDKQETLMYEAKKGQNHLCITRKHRIKYIDKLLITTGDYRQNLSVLRSSDTDTLCVYSGDGLDRFPKIEEGSDILLKLEGESPSKINDMRKMYANFGELQSSSVHCLVFRTPGGSTSEVYSNRMYSPERSCIINDDIITTTFNTKDRYVIICHDVEMIYSVVKSLDLMSRNVILVTPECLLPPPSMLHSLARCKTKGVDKSIISEIYKAIFESRIAIDIICGGTHVGGTIKISKSISEFFTIYLCGSSSDSATLGDKMYMNSIIPSTLENYVIESEGELLYDDSIVFVENDYMEFPSDVGTVDEEGGTNISKISIIHQDSPTLVDRITSIFKS